MMTGCPGAGAIKGTPTITLKLCPQCGNEIELFSSEIKTPCTKCGFEAYNDTQTCITWCKYAKECVGEELYNQFMQRPQEDAPEAVGE